MRRRLSAFRRSSSDCSFFSEDFLGRAASRAARQPSETFSAGVQSVRQEMASPEYSLPLQCSSMSDLHVSWKSDKKKIIHNSVAGMELIQCVLYHDIYEDGAWLGQLGLVLFEAVADTPTRCLGAKGAELVVTRDLCGREGQQAG